MRVMPEPGDSEEEVALMNKIEEEWQASVRLQKESDAAEKRHGLLRSQLRMLHEGLVEGEILTMVLSNSKGRLEVSHDVPYLFLRVLDKHGEPTKRRLRLEEGEPITRADGSTPQHLHPK